MNNWHVFAYVISLLIEDLRSIKGIKRISKFPEMSVFLFEALFDRNSNFRLKRIDSRDFATNLAVTVDSKEEGESA